MPNLLEINNLRTSFLTSGGEVQAVRGVSMSIGRSESVGIVGESGSGKSVTFLSVLRLLASTGRIQGGEILFEGKDFGADEPQGNARYSRQPNLNDLSRPP